MDAYREGRVTEEPKVTERIIQALEDRIQALPIGGIVWTALSLRSGSGRAADETRHGADFMGVLDIEITRFAVKKGFLAQAKRAEPGVVLSRGEWQRLVDQCDLMLSRTTHAFVFVYSAERGVRVFSALDVRSFDGRDIFELYDRRISTFFEYHIECMIGDPRLDSPNIQTLEQLVDLPIQQGVVLRARQAD
jgi:hypothetical protein